jgi:hypothetical protein
MTDNEYYGYGYHDHSNMGQQGQHDLQKHNQTTDDNEQLLQSVASHQLQQRKQRSSSMPLWNEDTTRAAAPLVAASSNAIWDDPINISRRMEKSRPPCNHYERNCTIVSPCCGLAFGCRICHDECPVLPMPYARRPPPLPDAQNDNSTNTNKERILNWDALAKHKQEKRRSMPLSYEEYAGVDETHHEIDRFSIAEIICRLCYTRQTSKT